jgi:hypothetical protein
LAICPLGSYFKARAGLPLTEFRNMELKMIRTFALSSLAMAAFALPAMAATASFSATKDATLDRVLDNAAMSQQIRNQLMSNGFTHVSAITRSSPNRWEGTAMKNGKLVPVAVLFPPAPRANPAID